MNKLAMALLLGMFLISFASALEFDNVMNHNKENNEIVITNAFGLGSDLIKAQLQENGCDENGRYCSAIIPITLYEDGKLIEDKRFYTMNGEEKYLQDVRWSKYEYYDNVDDYETECYISGYFENGTEISYCEDIKVGSHKDWIIFTNEDFISGDYLVRLSGEKKPSRRVDWQIKIKGEWTTPWAVWGNISEGDDAEVILNSPYNASIQYNNPITFNASANITGGSILQNISLWTYEDNVWGLRNTSLSNYLNAYAYWELDENTGTNARDSVGNLYNGTLLNSPTWTTGIIGSAVNFTPQAAVQSVNMSSSADLMPSSGSWNAWIYPITGECSPESDYCVYLSKWNSDNKGMQFGVNDSDYLGIWTDGGGWDFGNATINLDNWNMITVTFQDGVASGTNIYLNGEIIGISTEDWTSNAGNFRLGSTANAGDNGDARGLIDEVGIWDSILTPTQISTLYNSGSGARGLVGTQTWDYSVPLGNTLWNVQACDSDGDCGFAENNYTITLLLDKLNEYYVSSTISGATNPFNVTFNSSSQITQAYLNYNGINYLGNINNSEGSVYILNRNNVAPTVSTPTNLSFYWNITNADGLYYSTTPQNQTVSPIVINQTCSGMYVIKNFTIFNETNLVSLNATTLNTTSKLDLQLYNKGRTQALNNFSYEYSKLNPFAVCIDNNLSGGEEYVIDIQIQYEAIGYTTELYHIFNDTLNSNNLNENISLLLLDNDNSQTFKIKARDTSYLPIDGALIQIDRKYINQGSFNTSEIPKTDANGETSASLEVNDVIYNFYVYLNGTLISSHLNKIAVCQTPLVKECEIDLNAFVTAIDVPDYTTGSDFNLSSLGYNDTSRLITATFDIPSGEPADVEVVVISQDTLGTTVNSSSLTSASGTINVLVPNNFGNSSLMVKVYKNDIEMNRGSLKLDQDGDDLFGVIRIFLAIMIMFTLIGLGISNNPIITSVFLFIGVMFLFAINIVDNSGFIGETATILFIGVAIILIIIKSARRT